MLEAPDIAVRQVSWRTHSSTLSSIRRQVFIQEQGVAEFEEWDGLDELARHFLALSPSGEAVGTARLLVEATEPNKTASYHIGRVSVFASWRCRGIGTALMREVIRWCQQDASPRLAYIHLNAQCDRLSFYQRLGFEAEGEVFIDAGIPHRAMFLESRA